MYRKERNTGSGRLEREVCGRLPTGLHGGERGVCALGKVSVGGGRPPGPSGTPHAVGLRPSPHQSSSTGLAAPRIRAAVLKETGGGRRAVSGSPVWNCNPLCAWQPGPGGRCSHAVFSVIEENGFKALRTGTGRKMLVRSGSWLAGQRAFYHGCRMQSHVSFFRSSSYRPCQQRANPSHLISDGTDYF